MWTLVISVHTSRTLTSFALVHELFIALSKTLSTFFVPLITPTNFNGIGNASLSGCTAGFGVHHDVGEIESLSLGNFFPVAFFDVTVTFCLEVSFGF